MKQIAKLQNRLVGLTNAINRFPITILFLLGATVINAMDINSTNDYSKYIMTFVVGAFLGIVGQVSYERFFDKSAIRISFFGGTVILTLLYYLIIRSVLNVNTEVWTRTLVALFALYIAFIWIPVIKSKISFNESFMVSFKAFFIALFFSGVIYGGISLINVTVNQLLFTIDYRSYSHTGNLIFLLFAPMYFLSLIPVYTIKSGGNVNNEQEDIQLQEDNIIMDSNCPKYLEILISYIIIPLTAVFTIILLFYIIRNISGKFWTDNLLEPMIVSYSITVILIYILASRIENKLADVFRVIFPKILVPIVLFQTISSFLKIGNMGITYNRYYVILYGIFATIAGIVFSIFPVRKNGIIAALLIVFSAISIVPPVDAFTVSKNSQIQILESILIKNDMLRDNKVMPNGGISKEDKQKIYKSLEYLNNLEYTKKVSWLPKDYNQYTDFHETFGFDQYEDTGEVTQYVYVNLNMEDPIDIAGYDYLVNNNTYITSLDTKEEVIGKIEKSNMTYILMKNVTKEDSYISLINEQEEELIRFSFEEVIHRFENYNSEKSVIDIKDATFTMENDKASITIIVKNFNVDKSVIDQSFSIEFYILVKIK